MLRKESNVNFDNVLPRGRFRYNNRIKIRERRNARSARRKQPKVKGDLITARNVK